MTRYQKTQTVQDFDKFADALRDPNANLPANLRHSLTGRHEDSFASFAVYRNNVAFGLRQVLRDKFPLLGVLLGAQAFEDLIGYYVDIEPPRSPLLVDYGESFPDFLDGLPSLESLAFASDVARLEWAMQQAYYAADHVPMAATDIANLTPEDVLNFCPRFAPCVQILASPWPIYQLWQFLKHDSEQPTFSATQAETVMVFRFDYEIQLTLLTPEKHAFLIYLADGRSIGDAMVEAHLALEDFDAIFVQLVTHKLIAS